jgi:hypothetical protein
MVGGRVRAAPALAGRRPDSGGFWPCRSGFGSGAWVAPREGAETACCAFCGARADSATPPCPPARQTQPHAPQCAGDVSGHERMSVSLRHRPRVAPRMPANLAILANRDASGARHPHESQDSHERVKFRTVEPAPTDAGRYMPPCACVCRRLDGTQSNTRCRTAVEGVGLWSVCRKDRVLADEQARATHRSHSRARNDQVSGVAGTIRRVSFPSARGRERRHAPRGPRTRNRVGVRR